ncbi:MAG TPA: amidohydrolase family protein [Puia sp.]|nr:amidohydrolase family protein [Puia sp.]
MLRIIFCILLFVIHLDGEAQFILEHINIINVLDGTIQKDQSIRLENGLIKSISHHTSDNSKYKIYDCSGKFIIPGLWDMHIHDGGDSSTRCEYIPLFLANGVTGVRDMWGSEEMLKLRDEIKSGKFTGPRMIVGSPIVDGAKPFFRSSLSAKTPEQGRHYVDSLKDAGYDFIKIYSLLREPVYLAIADECKNRSIPMEGHLPIEIGLEEALEADQRSFEHNFNINRYLSRNEKPSIQWAHDYLDTVHVLQASQFMVLTEPTGISEKDFYLPEAVLDKMRKDRVAIVPTLTLLHGRGIIPSQMAVQTKGLNYLTEEFVHYWMHQEPAFPPEFIKSFGAAARFLMDKNVLILAGTDVNNPFCVPGFGLQQELINLHEAGLTDLQVIQTATINPARFLYMENVLGTVTEGKFADLLILDDNPLMDITNTQKIFAVIVNGKYISHSDIADILKAQKKR